VRETSWKALVLLAIVAGGSMLRVHDLGADSLWLDEFFALENSTGRGFEHWRLPLGQVIEKPPPLTSLEGAPPVWAIWRSLRGDTHPPLHFMLLRFWRDLFGEGDVAARSLSLLFGVLSLPLLFVLARRLLGEVPGLWATLLMAVAPVHVRYAQEARNYTMALCLVLIAALVIVAPSGKPRVPSLRSGLLLSLVVLAATLTHYFAVTALAALALYVLLQGEREGQRRVLLALVLAAAVFVVVWGPEVWAQRINFARHFDIEAPEGHALLTLERWLAVPVWFLVGTPVPAEPGAAEIALGLLCHLTPFLLLRRRPELLLPALWLTGATLLLALIDGLRNNATLSVPRYPLLASPGLFLGLAAVARGRLWRHLVPLAAAGLALAHLDRAYGGRADWREVAAFVRHGMREGEVLVVDFEGQQRWFPATKYLALSHYLGRACPPLVLLEGAVGPATEDRLREAGVAWVITKSGEGTFAERLGGQVTGQALEFPLLGVIREVRFGEGSPDLVK
jgi:dolichyl-phosphate-mannose-protein mannosyltransferase